MLDVNKVPIDLYIEDYRTILERVMPILNKMDAEYDNLYQEGKISNSNYALKVNRIEQVFNYIIDLNLKIQSAWQFYENTKNQLKELREDTQRLVLYCELKGINPNIAFHLRKFTTHEISNLAKEVTQNKQAGKISDSQMFHALYLDRFIEQYDNAIFQIQEKIEETKIKAQ